MNAHTLGIRLHTQDTGVNVIPKTLMRRFLECKIPGVPRVGVSLKVLALQLGLFLPQREQLWIRHGGGEGRVVGGTHIRTSGSFNIWALLVWVGHMHR